MTPVDKEDIELLKSNIDDCKTEEELADFLELIVDNIRGEIPIICNNCGGTCRIEDGVLGLIGTHTQGSWDSKYLKDGDQYRFNLCEECLAKLLKSFKISAYVGNKFGSSEEDGEEVDV